MDNAAAGYVKCIQPWEEKNAEPARFQENTPMNSLTPQQILMIASQERAYEIYSSVLNGTIPVSFSTSETIKMFDLLTSDSFQLWRDAIVPFNVNWSAIPMVRDLDAAMTHIEQRTCVRFVERTTEFDYVEFICSTECSSRVGRSGGMQYIRLIPWCKISSIVHEIMHALGFHHEHQRLDRDDYLTILWDNVEEDKRKYFDKVPPMNNFDRLGEFDYNSVMMYIDTAGAINDSLKTMKPKHEGIKLKSKSGNLLTDLDAKRINNLYYSVAYYCN